METLKFSFSGAETAATKAPAALVGVVSSGNLEILVEANAGSDTCEVEVSTGAMGFETIWAAVLADFFQRHPCRGVRISINDMGASPAVVSLRLDQAMDEFLGGAS